MSGMVVYVGKPINCDRCGGTGLARCGFVHGPKGPICPDCNGAKLTHEAMPIEEFAKLFTYGQTYAGSCMEVAPDNEIRVRSTEAPTPEKG